MGLIEDVIGTALTPVTAYAAPNEKCWAYIETQEQSPDFSGFHRYRLIYVNRDGRISEYKEDMGRATSFIGAKSTIHIPSIWEHSVEELKNLADELRWDVDIDILDWLELDSYKAV
uniref:Uncharacterized protein n=1 Tax=viral metagenome TaxID=1070528 RepID=A0A6M3IG14_9ZZZZ